MQICSSHSVPADVGSCRSGRAILSWNIVSERVGCRLWRGDCVARAPSPAIIHTPSIHLHALVVMPNDVHLLLRPLRDANGWPFPLLDILQCFKGATAHRINKLLHTSGPVWEEESFDHVLRSDESLKEKCEYIRQNPVLAGLVRRSEEYRWLWVNPEMKI